MYFLRLIGFLLLIAIGVSLLTFVFTRDRRYLTFAWRVLISGFAIAAITLVFLLAERLMMAI